MFSRLAGLGRKGRQGQQNDKSSREETAGLLNSAKDDSSAEKRIEVFLDNEAQETVDTTNLEVPEVPEEAKTFIKQFTYFSNAGYIVEFASCVLIFLLGFNYLFSGCLLVGGCMLGVGFTLGWLCVPQIALPFVTNAIVRWFIVTNHSHHLTGLLSIIGAFVVLSYFSWTNSCKSESTWIQATTTTVLALLCTGIILFFVACFRDEKGNGGYIKWMLRLVF
jgi:hypothetical protein